MKNILKKHPFGFTWVTITSVLYSALYVGISILLQQVIDLSMEGDPMRAVTASVIYISFCAIFYLISRFGLVRLNQTISAELRSKVADSILTKRYRSFYEHDPNDYISLVQNDVKKIEESYLDTTITCISSFVQLVLGIVVMTHYSYVFTLTMLGMTALMFVIPATFSPKMSKATQEVSDLGVKFTQGFSELVYGYDVTKSFQKEAYRSGKFEKRNHGLMRGAIRLGLLREANDGISNVLGIIMQMVICILAGRNIYKGTISYGSMMGVVQVSGSITQPLFTLFGLLPFLKSFTPIWNKLEDRTKPDEVKEDLLITDWNKIKLDHVSFAYADAAPNVLADVDLTIEKGKKYLITGESGSGKSTLINILAGKLTAKEGEIFIDSTSVNKDNEALLRMTAGVWQNTYLFDDTIRENINQGTECENRLSTVLKQAELTDVTEQKGLDFIVGPNGEHLSGGQKQRIAIARALYAGKDIIILDEGVSALDKETAEAVEKTLLTMSGQTIISISHHLSESVMELYDEVYIVKDGKVQLSGKRQK